MHGDDAALPVHFFFFLSADVNRIVVVVADVVVVFVGADLVSTLHPCHPRWSRTIIDALSSDPQPPTPLHVHSPHAIRTDLKMLVRATCGDWCAPTNGGGRDDPFVCCCKAVVCSDDDPR